MPNYAEKLKDPRWQKKRLEILQRDEFTCTICQDKTTTLHIHHLKYKGDPWSVENNHLVSLCADCHLVIETYNIDYNDILVGLKKQSEDYVWVFIILKSKYIHFYGKGKTDNIISSAFAFSEGAFLGIIEFFKSKING